MRRVAVVVMLVTVALAYAGKIEREFMKNEVQPAARKAEAAWKSACGCVLKVNVKEASYKSRDDMTSARNIVNTVEENVKAYCTDGDSKAALCKMKTLDVMFGENATFTFKGSVGTVTTYGITAPSWDMLTRELDK
jgi:hypothetical protein